ncbi:MAG: Ig-like domain-containing protein, partial [Gemmatimonadales bacterium]
MRAATLLAAVALGGVAVSSPPGLHVLRVSPTERAEPTAAVTVTFDRPVAGQLEGTVDPRTIFTITPAVEGTVEWRDPITLRFQPASPLAPGTAYTVTIAAAFSAMDGTRLDQPYSFTFRVGGPRVLQVSAASGLHQFLRPEAQFDLVASSELDTTVVVRLVRLELAATCSEAGAVPLGVVLQRPIGDRDPVQYRMAGGWQRDRRLDPLRRLVRLAPQRRLPSGCAFDLVVPRALDPGGAVQRWHFSTYGPLRLVRVSCGWEGPKVLCPVGSATLEFSTPIRGTEIARAVRFSAPAPYALSDTSNESERWVLEEPLRAHTAYTVTADSSLQDIFGQRLGQTRQVSFTTTGFEPDYSYPNGSLLVERQGFRTLAVKHVNTDSLFVTMAPVPESLEARVLAAPPWNLADAMPPLAAGTSRRVVPTPGPVDVPLISAVKVPAYNAASVGAPTLTAVRISRVRNDTSWEGRRSAALVQVTDIGIAARVGAEEAIVWVTTIHDGKSAAGANVVLYGPRGRVRARGTSDAQGLVRLRSLAPDSSDEHQRWGYGFEGYIAATLGNDRAIVSLSSYAWELSPWRFNVASADPARRVPAAAAVFTERGIYRPGETVHAKAIVRTGSLGALRAPARRDSLHWVFYDREGGTLKDTTVAVSGFGTADQALAVPADLALGDYRIGVQLRRGGAWTELANASYRVAEYRPPEFLVDVAADTSPHVGGDSLSVTIQGRYLFGAPMARAALGWMMRRTPLYPYQLGIPNTEGYLLGETGWWWEDEEEGTRTAPEVTVSGTDTLDDAGRRSLRLPLGQPIKGRPARVTIQATVTDVNRQTVTGSASATVHPAAFYIGAKPLGEEYFWRAGTEQSIAVIAVRPDGQRVNGVAVRGSLVRQEWHRVQRERGGVDELVGRWVPDTLAHCDVTTGPDPAACKFTPGVGGTYVVGFRATDEAGRVASTSFYRWATGRGWVPWGDESQLKMDVIPDRVRYDVGDTATVLLASPFTDAEAWVTVEREGVIEQRRLRITSGATSLKFRLNEAWVPNVFVSVVVQRARSAPGGHTNDPGRPAIRVGYAELRVTPRIKRLHVDVQPLAAEYRPGDSARVHVTVTDVAGTGRRSEVTLWAVDEGVLALTGYRTPDPVDLLYQPRGVAMRLGSNLIEVAAQVLDSEGVSIKGEAEPGGGGGRLGGDVLRSRFASTAFFLGSVVTDSNGQATAAARLPDNLTTFRVMAVAVTSGDRYGSGQSSVLVSRPLLARPALPRFLRREDQFVAGVVVNQRAGGTPTVRVAANARGVTISDSTTREVTLAAGTGREVRFNFRDTTADTAAFRFDVSDGRDSDAVLTRLPVRPSHAPRAHTIAGVLVAGATADFTLPGDIDPDRSRVVFGIGTTPLAIIGGMYRQLEIYPYDCTEQLADELMTAVALVRAGAPGGRRLAPTDARERIGEAIAALTRRQRADGGIGLWSPDDWTSPWLSAYAGEALLAAKAAGFTVRDTLIARLADYLQKSVHQRPAILAPVASWMTILQVRLGEDVAAVDFLSRAGRTDVPGENDLLRRAAQIAWEDRVRLAEVVARRGERGAARALLEPIWANVRIEGRRAVLPDSAVREFYFWSAHRPAARLLSATLAVDSSHPLIGPLVENLVEQGRTRGWWNTQDYGAAVEALADFSARQQRALR